MSGHPSAADLVDAVRFYLASIESKLSGREAFHAKVAGNVLAIVERELRERPEGVEGRVLSSLTGHAAPIEDLRGELCAMIREGRLAADTPGVVDALIEGALARLAVDNPNFSTYRRMTEKKT